MGQSGAGGAITVMLVGGYRIALLGLEKLIEAHSPQMQVVASATSCRAALELAKETPSQVIVVDPDDSPESAAHCVSALVAGALSRVLVLTGIAEARVREDLVLRGACGIVQKHEPPDVLIKAVRKVAQGELWLDRGAIGRLFVQLSQHKPPRERATGRFASLTAREREVVRNVALHPGADNRALARALHVGESTLRNHLSHIYDKLGVANRTHLYVLAEQHLK